MDTVFYATGAALVVIALIVSAIGMRSDNFPSNGVLRIGVLFVALVVVATGYTAVEASQEEALAREEEEDQLAAEQANEAAAKNEAAGVSGSDTGVVGVEGKPAPSGEQGSAVFADNGCGSCHTLADQGDQALGEIGPNLDAQLVDQNAAYIETQIADPSAIVVDGFGDNIMPSDYAETIAPEDLAALVAYLDEVTSESSSAK